jgi:hypothetical protein
MLTAASAQFRKLISMLTAASAQFRKLILKEKVHR